MLDPGPPGLLDGQFMRHKEHVARTGTRSPDPARTSIGLVIAGARARLTPGLLLVATQCAVRLYWRKAATSTDWSLSEGIVMSKTYLPEVPPIASAAAAESRPSSLI